MYAVHKFIDILSILAFHIVSPYLLVIRNIFYIVSIQIVPVRDYRLPVFYMGVSCVVLSWTHHGSPLIDVVKSALGE